LPLLFRGNFHGIVPSSRNSGSDVPLDPVFSVSNQSRPGVFTLTGHLSRDVSEWISPTISDLGRDTMLVYLSVENRLSSIHVSVSLALFSLFMFTPVLYYFILFIRPRGSLEMNFRADIRT
jgi:hypothetical protein